MTNVIKAALSSGQKINVKKYSYNGTVSKGKLNGFKIKNLFSKHKYGGETVNAGLLDANKSAAAGHRNILNRITAKVGNTGHEYGGKATSSLQIEAREEAIREKNYYAKEKRDNQNKRTYFEQVPLSNSEQDIIYECAEKYGLDPALVFAVIETESTFNKNIGINSYNCAGLMQMNLTYSKPYGVTKDNYTDVYTNVNGGCMLLAEKYKKYGDWNVALMAYNIGDGGAQKRMKRGVYSNEYSIKVLNRKEKYK